MIDFAFVTAGSAIFTIEVPESFRVENGCNAHYTFRVSKKKDKDLWFVALLTGPNNQADYSYMGVLDKRMGVRLTGKSRVTNDAWSYKLVRRVVSCLRAGEGQKILDAGFDVHHEGRCGRCARPLTDPISIDAGLGPHCRGEMSA